MLKVSRGGSESKLKKRLEECFRKVQYFKPEASFKDSTEIYLVGIGFKKPKHDTIAEFNYTIVPNTSTEGFLANQTERKFDQTLTEKSTVTSPPKAAPNNENSKNSTKEDIKEDLSAKKDRSVLVQSHPATKKQNSHKKQERYQINKIFAYRKLI